jgi:hypothetical protein
VRLAAIAFKASGGQIVDFIFAAIYDGNDVIDFKHNFRRFPSAILTCEPITLEYIETPPL